MSSRHLALCAAGWGACSRWADAAVSSMCLCPALVCLRSLRSVLQNVLSFDSFEEQLQNTLVEVFYKHGIPAGPVRASLGWSCAEQLLRVGLRGLAWLLPARRKLRELVVARSGVGCFSCSLCPCCNCFISLFLFSGSRPRSAARGGALAAVRAAAAGAVCAPLLRHLCLLGTGTELLCSRSLALRP